MRSRPHNTLLRVIYGLALVLAGCKDSSQGSSTNAAVSTAPIPRFPVQGLPSGTSAELPQTTTNTTTGTPSQPEPGEQPTQEPGVESSSATTKNETTSESPDTSDQGSGSASTTGEVPGDTSSNDAPTDDSTTPPAQAPYVDAAYIKIAKDLDGKIGKSFKWQSPRNEGEYIRLGYRSALYGGERIVLERRSYLIFDVRKVQSAKKAYIEIFVFASSLATNNYGGYTSEDPFEVVEIRSISRYTPEEIIKAPYNQDRIHTFDVGLFNELGQGTLYARRKITPDFLDEKKLRPTPTATQGHRDCEDTLYRACGRWLRFELTQDAVADINKSQGLWATGWSMPSVNHDASKEPVGSKRDVIEWLFVGGFIDLSPSNGNYPTYLGPKPKLILEY